MRPDTSEYESCLALLGRSPLFAKLEPDLVADLLGAFRRETWERKTSGMTWRHALDRLYLILSGRLEVARSNPETGRDVTLFLLGPGDAFDVVTLLDGRPHEVVTLALDDLEVLSAPLGLVHQWIERHPDFNRTLLPYLGAQMRALSELATDLALHDTTTRLARLILRHADLDHPHRSLRLINDLSHEHLAGLIGSVRAVVNRQIQHLKQDGVISASRGKLAIRDLNALLEQSHGFGALEPRRRSPGGSQRPPR